MTIYNVTRTMNFNGRITKEAWGSYLTLDDAQKQVSTSTRNTAKKYKAKFEIEIEKK